MGLGDADDAVAVAVGGGVEVLVSPDGVAQGLDDRFRGLVVPGGPGAGARARAIDSEGRCSSVEEEGKAARLMRGLEWCILRGCGG